ncbi:hypothetical protein FB567DRAFT_583528 [Paraphoma chrysanthemicola]|uniref:Fungal N-terminal domain-containing protein n=1 Tax=Paraphoma chrysanthemicola TaxID=798071 RepID=A0A8K0VUG4_9PLEO|nr:hypothetical protein FB567DRAFT_583528 [Paraphoma chrysanthemicola]
MPFAVSIGDAFLLAKLALRIAQAFTKGRKSAPAEFREVESQLYSLSAALDALRASRESDTSSPLLVDVSQLPRTTPPHHNDKQDIIIGMLGSCKATLDHLESIVEKYSILGTATDTDCPRLKRWSRDLKANWKKIAWTTEGGDLIALKNNLTIQTNSLNLVLGVVINSQANRLQDGMDHISTMLTDIHAWFAENLKNTAAVALVTTTSIPVDTHVAPLAELHFTLYEHSGLDSKLLCPRASLHGKSLGTFSSSSLKNSQLFNCGCAFPTGNPNNHKAVVEAYGLSPLSFPTRIAGNERSWLLYKVTNKATNQLVSLLIKGVSRDVMYDFEEFLLHSLSVVQARDMLRRSMSTGLVHVSSVETQFPKAHLLDIISDVPSAKQNISSAKFTSGNMKYIRDSIGSVQIMHYKSIGLRSILDNPALPQSMFEQDSSAEVVIVYRNRNSAEAGDVVRTILHLRWNSETKHSNVDSTVEVKNIDCTSFDAMDKPHPTTSVAVTFEFATREAASDFHKKLEATRMELFIIRLKFPQDNEKVMLRVQAQDVHTERMHISDAEITILQNTTTQRFRLVVQSRNGYSILSQDLKEDFFESLATHGRPKYNSTTYEVYVDGTGKRRVHKYPNGFTRLGFSEVKIDQLFAIGLASLGGARMLLDSEEPEPMQDVVPT